MEKKMIEESLKKAKRMMVEGDLVGAKEEAEAILAESPSEERALNLLGMVYFKVGEYRRSAEIFEQLIEANPGVVALYVNAGLSHLKTGDYKRALEFFEKALNLNPTSRSVLNYAGYTLSQMGKYEEAKEMFLRAGSTRMADEMNRKIEESGRPIFEETGGITEELPADEVKRDGEYLIVNVRNGLYTSMGNVVVLRGTVEMKPIKKRFEKKELKSFFKVKGNQFYCIQGEGSALLKAEGLTISNVNGEIWVNEDFVAGFVGDVDWENARISTGSEGYVNIVVIKGKGFVFLKSPEPLKKIDVKDDDLMVKPSSLVGWSGDFSVGEAKIFNDRAVFLVMKGTGEVFVK